MYMSIDKMNYCAERHSTAQYGGDLVTWCNVTNMSAKNNSESGYYGGDLFMWCNVNMSAKNNSESEYYGEILSGDVRLLTCRQKIIVKVNIMGEIL